MRKIKRIDYSIYINNLILVVFAITLFLLTLSNFIYVVFLFMYLIYLYKKAKQLAFLSIVLIIIIGIIYILYRYDNGDRSTLITGKIIDANSYDNYKKYIIRVNTKKILLYDYNNFNLQVGDIVQLKGDIKNIDTVYIPNDFDYSLYLKNNHIFYSLIIKEVNILDNTFVLSKIRYLLIDYIDSKFSDESASFLKALLVSYTKGLDEEFYNSLKENGIIHLFAISGLHVAFFTNLLSKLLTKIKIKDGMQTFLISAFLMVYIIITNFSPSILRTSIMYLITKINKKKNLNLSSLDICSTAFILMVLINPLTAFNNGFILSYLVSFTIIMLSPLINNYSNNMQIFLISLVASFTTLPVIININYEVNLLTPLINVIFIGIVTILMLPLSLLVIVASPLDYLYKYIVIGFSKISVYVSNIFNLSFKLPKFTPQTIILYYSIIFAIIICKDRKKKIKRLIMLIIYLIALNNINLLKPFGEIYFLDMYYGESTVIFSPYKNSVVIIDTGDGTNNALSSFLKSKGVKNIECLIITHNHLDHMGEIDNLYKEFNVRKTVISSYDDYNYHYPVTKIKDGQVLELDRFSFLVISPQEKRDDANDNSLVLYGKVNGKQILLMADASKNIEEKMISEISKMDIDILKVGHHGSKTASSYSFLKTANPEIAIIMAGRKSMYDFPHQETINNLNKLDIETYCTRNNKSIWFRSIGGFYRLYSLA